MRELVVRRQREVADVRRALDRQYLTGSEVEAQAREQGAVRFPSRATPPCGRSIQREVQRALNAFRAASTTSSSTAGRWSAWTAWCASPPGPGSPSCA